MSKEAAQAAIEKLKADEAFRARIMECESVEERLRQIREEGFDCTAEEIEQLPREMFGAELDAVSGAAFCFGFDNWCMTKNCSHYWCAMKCSQTE